MAKTGRERKIPSTAPRPAPAETPKDVRRDQRVAEQVLVGGPGGGEGGTDEEGCADPGQADAEQDGVDGGSAVAAGEPAPEGPRDVAGAQGIGAGQQRERW